MRVWVLIFLMSTMGLSGCSGVRDRIFGAGEEAQGLPFRAVLARGADRRNFTVRVRAGAVPVEQVRESVRFPATRYCLTTYGASDTRWTIDPATRDWAFQQNGNDMVFSGRCVAR
jgi:hypothetical protein